MKKAALHNLGCKVNAYETEAMQEMLEQAGYEIVPFKEVLHRLPFPQLLLHCESF